MDDELASVKGVVDLPSHDALDQAQSFLSRQGYTTVRREGNTLFAERRPSDQAAGQEAPKLTVSAVPQPRGGVRITVRGKDREGVQERQAAWIEWSESLPKKSETYTNEPGDHQRTIETPNVPLPPPLRVASSDVPSPSPPPRRGSSRLLVGSLVGCGVLSILVVLLIGTLVIGANVGMQKAKEQAQTTAEKGETKNTPSKQESDSIDFLPVVLRVSGNEGTGYRCSFATDALEEGEVVRYTSDEQGTLGTTPVDYAAQIIGESSSRPPSSFNANCSMTGPFSGGKSKDQPKVLTGRLKAEVLVNDAVKDEDETRPDPAGKSSQESSFVQVNYYPPCDGPMPKDKGKGKAC